MHTRVVEPKRGPTLLVRPLHRGDIDTVIAVFERLDEDSRRRRFNDGKPRLGQKELRWLAAADSRHHALVAYVDGDPRPVAIARLVRSGSSAEIAFEVADEYQQRGIGTALTTELLADACAAGITEITALVSSRQLRPLSRYSVARYGRPTSASRAENSQSVRRLRACRSSPGIGQGRRRRLAVSAQTGCQARRNHAQGRQHYGRIPAAWRLD